MRKLNDLTSEEINRITHLYANGYTDSNWLAGRFDLDPKDVEELTKEVKVLNMQTPKFKPGDKLVVTVSEKSKLAKPEEFGYFEYQFEELPGLWIGQSTVEDKLMKLIDKDDIHRFMREKTAEESEAVNKYLAEHSIKTGVSVYGLMEEENE